MSEQEHVLASASIKVTKEQMELIEKNFGAFQVMVNQKFSELLREHAKTNDLLAALVDALAEEGQDPDAPPARYLDGSKVR